MMHKPNQPFKKPEDMTEAERLAGLRSSDGLGALVEFIEGKLIEAFASLKAREEMETVWRGGTDESWRAVGCSLTKAQRLKDSAMHGRIAAKLRREVELFKVVLERLKAPNAEL